MTSSRNARRKSCNRAINRAGNRWLSVTTSCMRWRTSPSLALLHKFSDRCRQLRNRQKFRQGFVELATRQFAQLRFWYMLREKRYCLWSPKQVCKLDRIDVWILGTPSNGLERDTAAIVKRNATAGNARRPRSEHRASPIPINQSINQTANEQTLVERRSGHSVELTLRIQWLRHCSRAIQSL